MRIGDWSRPAEARRSAAAVFVGIATIVVALALKHDFRDVAIYHAGANTVLHNGDLYGFRIHDHGFTYPPFAALLLSPLGAIPVSAMWCVLVALSCVSLVVLLRYSVPGLVAKVRAADVTSAVFLAALLLIQPVVAALQMGQIDLVIAVLVVFDVLVMRRGFLVGVAAALKLTPGLFVVYLLLCGRRREAATAIAVFAGSIALGALVLPHASSTYWRHFVFSGDGTGGFTTFHNQSIRGVAERMFGVDAGTDIWLALLLPALIAGLWLARRAVRADLEIIAVGVVGVTACLVSPLSWIHHWVWLIPVFGGLWARAGGEQSLLRSWQGRTALVWALVPNVPNWGPLHWFGLGYVLLAGLLAWLVIDAVREDRSVERAGGEVGEQRQLFRGLRAGRGVDDRTVVRRHPRRQPEVGEVDPEQAKLGV